jgi:hypothetical protein
MGHDQIAASIKKAIRQQIREKHSDGSNLKSMDDYAADTRFSHWYHGKSDRKRERVGEFLDNDDQSRPKKH